METTFRFYGPLSAVGCTTSDPCWYDVSTHQTGRSFDGTFVKRSTAEDLIDSAWRAGGLVKVCEDQPWSGDPCSGRLFPTFSY